MESTIALILFILAFILIFKGADLLVGSAIWISKKTGISPIVIGATIVSLATTLPETMVSILAVKSNDMALASGNAIGSMICNFGLILGVSFVLMPAKIDKHDFFGKCMFVVIDLFLITLFAIDGRISIVEGSILLFMFVIFMSFNVLEVKRSKRQITINYDNNYDNPLLMIFHFIVGAISIAYGSHVLVTNTSTVGELLHIDHKVLGLTIVAAGTSLPELITTLSSIKKNTAGIGIGNMLGANILNGTMLLGICGVMSKGRLIFGSSIAFTLAITFLVSLIVILPIVLAKRTFRIQGIMLIITYITYSVLLYFMNN